MLKTKSGHPAFVAYVVAGYPTMETCEKAIDALVEEGMDVLELGIPFSDAMADGPVIQAASEGASRSVRLDDVLGLAKRVRNRHPGLELVLFTYFNPVLKRGVARFAQEAHEAGVDAVLVVDLPPEEAVEYRQALDGAGVKTVFLASPTTSPERLAAVARASTGFVYYVSRMGVTGVQSQVSETLSAEVARLRTLTDRPIAVGFGVSTGEQARQIGRIADGVVVGSAFVRLMDPEASQESVVTQVRKLARELVEGIHSG